MSAQQLVCFIYRQIPGRPGGFGTVNLRFVAVTTFHPIQFKVDYEIKNIFHADTESAGFVMTSANG